MLRAACHAIVIRLGLAASGSFLWLALVNFYSQDDLLTLLVITVFASGSVLPCSHHESAHHAPGHSWWAPRHHCAGLCAGAVVLLLIDP